MFKIFKQAYFLEFFHIPDLDHVPFFSPSYLTPTGLNLTFCTSIISTSFRINSLVFMGGWEFFNKFNKDDPNMRILYFVPNYFLQFLEPKNALPVLPFELFIPEKKISHELFTTVMFF